MRHDKHENLTVEMHHYKFMHAFFDFFFSPSPSVFSDDQQNKSSVHPLMDTNARVIYFNINKT